MNLILMGPNLNTGGEMLERLATITIPDNSHITPKIIYPMACIACAKMHDAYFVHVGMHDDGEIYRLERIHQ